MNRVSRSRFFPFVSRLRTIRQTARDSSGSAVKRATDIDLRYRLQRPDLLEDVRVLPPEEDTDQMSIADLFLASRF